MKTTKKHFDDFQTFCHAWQSKLGLVNWGIYYYHNKLNDSYAVTNWKLSGSVASITLSTSWDNGRPFSIFELERLALHEMLHVLMAQFVAEAEDRFTNQSAIDIAEHNIIRTLESVLMGGKDA